MKRIAALLVAFALAGSAVASDHFAIIRNSDNENKPVAMVEMSSVQQTAMTTTVFVGASAGTASATLDEGNEFFAIADLVAIGNGLEPGQARLVRCTSNAALATRVILRGDQGEVYVPPIEQSLGKRFLFPLGDLGKGVRLLVGNPNQGDIEADVWGSRTTFTRHSIAPFGVVDIPLTVAHVSYNVTTVGPPDAEPRVIAALVFSEKGRSSRIVMLTPII